jgi:NTP pyrophosphatase (non-canonical NTP hydrolase)
MDEMHMNENHPAFQLDLAQFRARLPRYGIAYATVFNAMREEVWKFCEQKGWHQDQNSMAEYVALLHSEVSEILEAWRDHHDAEPHYKIIKKGDSPTVVKPIGVDSEMADVLIRLLDTAHIFGVDLFQAYAEKMAYNRTRPYQHGGRTLKKGEAS